MGGNDQVRLVGLTASTLVEGGAGNDTIDGSSVLVAKLELRGDAGNDYIRGGANDDYLVGGDGNDVLLGGGGKDWILGGAGKDVLFGDDGNDVLYGGAGDDVEKGGNGDDWLVRGPGNDKLDGGAGVNHTVDYAAFLAGNVPGMPAQPVSMLDWRWSDATDAGAGPGDCKVDWHGKCGAWGLADSWRQKRGFAEFAELRVTRDVERGSGARTRDDRKDD
jgi:Ca2+-binding RTX toxin-like protein